MTISEHMPIIGLEAGMPRPKSPRWIRGAPQRTWFKPAGVPMRELEEVTLSLDEIEAVRLTDLEGLYQEEAARQMGVSRQTLGRISASAHRKIAEALVEGKAIRVEGGTVTVRGERAFHCLTCGSAWSEPSGTGPPDACPSCHSSELRRAAGRGGASGPEGLRPGAGRRGDRRGHRGHGRGGRGHRGHGGRGHGSGGGGRRGR